MDQAFSSYVSMVFLDSFSTLDADCYTCVCFHVTGKARILCVQKSVAVGKQLMYRQVEINHFA